MAEQHIKEITVSGARAGYIATNLIAHGAFIFDIRYPNGKDAPPVYVFIEDDDFRSAVAALSREISRGCF